MASPRERKQADGSRLSVHHCFQSIFYHFFQSYYDFNYLKNVKYYKIMHLPSKYTHSESESRYSSLTSNLLSRALRESFGPTDNAQATADYLNFPQRFLFEPLGFFRLKLFQKKKKCFYFKSTS